MTESITISPFVSGRSILLLGLVSLTLTLLLFPNATWSAGKEDGFIGSYLDCRSKGDEVKRLRCYDALIRSAYFAESDAETISEESIYASNSVEEERRKVSVDRLESLSRREERGMLTTDDPNYIVYASPIDDNLGDEKHTEFYLSLKYPLVDDWFSDLQKSFSSSGGQPGRFLNSITPDRLLLQYNGLYDFYAIESNRYDSAPIISRRQNPGISFEYDFAHGRETLRLGWFHESNGQQLEKDKLDQFEDFRMESGDDFALAKVSRGWDYAQVRWTSNSLRFDDPLTQDWFNYQVEMRFYCDCQGFGFISGREDDIWWEDGNDVKISDFDGLRGSIDGSFWNNNTFSLDAKLDLVTGLEHSFGQYLSGRVTLGAKWDNVSLTLFYFDGYGRDPSTYHIRTQYAGLGFELR